MSQRPEGCPGGLWVGLGLQGVSQGNPGQAGVPRRVPGGLGCSGVTRGVPRGSGPGRGCEGHPRVLWAARDRDSQGSLRRCNQVGVADGGGAPPPHIKARGSGGRAQSGAGGRRAGTERPGPRRAGPGGRVREGRREGGRGPGGRRGLRWGGAAVPHLIVHGWRPAPPPGPALLAAAAAAQRRPAALIVCQAPPPPLTAARPPASPAEPETTASPGRAPTAGPRRRLGPAARTDRRLGQSTIRTATRGVGLPTWWGPAGLRSEGRSPQPMGSPDRRGGRREGGRREASPAEGSARCAPHVEGGGGGTSAPRLRTGAQGALPGGPSIPGARASLGPS